jgi:hypothetical protein
MPSPAVALSVNKKKKACAAAIDSMECELLVVKAAADAIIYMEKSSNFALAGDWSEPMLTVWTFFQNLLEPDVRASAGSQEINKCVAALLGDWVQSGSYGPLDIKCKDQSVRGRCKAIVAAFYRAINDMNKEVTSFCLTVPEEELDYYPRALWHQFWNNLQPNVRFAAYEVHEKYLTEFVSEESKRNPDLEPFCKPDEELIDSFPDEIIAKLSSNSASKSASKPASKPAPAAPIDYTTSPYDDEDDDSKYIKVVMPDGIDRAADARYGCQNRKVLPPVVLLIPRGDKISNASSSSSSNNVKVGGALAGNKRFAETEAPEAAPTKRMSKRPIQALPAGELDLNTTASVALTAMDNLVNRGRFDAVDSDHRYGVLGEFWDEFMRELPDNIHDRIHLARGSARSFFRENF